MAGHFDTSMADQHSGFSVDAGVCIEAHDRACGGAAGQCGPDPARGPPLWYDGDAQMHEGVEVEQDWGLAVQPEPNFDVDQRVNW